MGDERMSDRVDIPNDQCPRCLRPLYGCLCSEYDRPWTMTREISGARKEFRETTRQKESGRPITDHAPAQNVLAIRRLVRLSHENTDQQPCTDCGGYMIWSDHPTRGGGAFVCFACGYPDGYCDVAHGRGRTCGTAPAVASTERGAFPNVTVRNVVVCMFRKPGVVVVR